MAKQYINTATGQMSENLSGIGNTQSKKSGKISGVKSEDIPDSLVGNEDYLGFQQRMSGIKYDPGHAIEKYSPPPVEEIGQTGIGSSSYDTSIQTNSELSNLEDTRANIQPFIDKFGAGLGTFAAKTVTATAGGLGSLFYGVPKAIIDGKFNHIYNNDFNKWLDKSNESIDDTFKVYMSDSERNGSFFDQTIGSSHFWTKSLLGDGMSFTAGAVLSAYALGGVTGLLGKAANALKLNSTIFTGAESLGALRTAVKLDQAFGGVGKVLNLGAKTAVGAMYEGGVEANDFIKQSVQRYQKDFSDKNGRLPDDNEMAKFNNDILPSANALFLGNVALVGASNFATLPGVFGKGVNETISEAKKGIGSRIINGVTEAFVKDSELKGIAKFGKVATLAAKPLASEGLMEEGGQNFMKNMALDYIDKHYNPDATKNNYDLANSLGNAFNSAYMTKDGWKEILSGMIIGGMGAANFKNMGAIETKEDGTKVWNKFGNLKNRKLVNFEDAQNSWWTGGIVGEFQAEHENNLRAKEIVDNVNEQFKQDKIKDVHDYFAQNMAKGQGIESQISHMNHQAAVNAEYDAAVLGEDHYTAKNMEQDAAFLGIKTRIDAGFHDTIYDELVTPIEKMSPQEFATTYGYENMTEQQIRDRQSNVVKQAKSKIQDTVDAIKFADNNRTFNLGTEEGRLNRDMLIYSIATNKSVGDRIDGLTKTVSDNIKGRLQKYTFDESQYDKATESELDKIEKLEASKEGKSKEEISAIDSKINARRSIIENHANAKEQTIRAKEILSQIEDGGYNAMTVQEAKDAQSVISRLFEAKKRHSHDNRTNEVLDIDEEKVRNETMTALDDLVKLNRRKEEALELYSLTKDPSRWSDFYKTERIGKRIEKMMLESNDKIIQSQNEEVETAKAHVDADPEATPEEISSKTGAETSTVNKIKALKAKINALKIQHKEQQLLDSINSQIESPEDKYSDIDELEQDLADAMNDPGASQEKIDHVAQFSKILDDIYNQVDNEVEQSDEIPDTKGLINPDSFEVQESDISASQKIETTVTDELNTTDKSNGIAGEDDLIKEANDKIAWLSENRSNNALNENASNTIQDFEKINVGSELTFELQPTEEFPIDNIEMVPIVIKSNGEVIGYVHTTQFIKDGKTSGDAEADIEALTALRSHIISNNGFKSKVTYRGNGKLIGRKTSDGRVNLNQRPTTEAFPGNVFISASTKGILNTNGFDKNGIIINQSKIEDGTMFRNGIYAILPVNKSQDGSNKILYIATPITATKLNTTDSNTISHLVRMFLQQSLKGSDVEFDRIADKISGEVMIGGNNDVRTLNGLKNIISIFTYSHNSFRDDLGLSKGNVNNPAFGINQSGQAIILSFGYPGNLTSYKIIDKQVFVKTAGETAWDKIDESNSTSIDATLNDIYSKLNSHLQSQLFYHNKALVGKKSLSIPVIESVEGKLVANLNTKDYSQILKENTQTNLGSYNIGTKDNPKYIYTVQGNVAFETPGIYKDKLQQGIRKPTKIFSEKIIENRILYKNLNGSQLKVEIENEYPINKNNRRVYYDVVSGNDYKSDNKSFLGGVPKNMNEYLSVDSDGNDSYIYSDSQMRIRSKGQRSGYIVVYDIPLSEWNTWHNRMSKGAFYIDSKYRVGVIDTNSKSSILKQIQTKQGIDSENKLPGTGRKIGRNNNISLDSPSFSNELKNNPNKINNSENLGKSFIEFANEQPKDIRQALKKMLQNKEIETKCK